MPPDAKAIALDKIGEYPPTTITNAQLLSCYHYPPRLQYVLLELLKNSMEANSKEAIDISVSAQGRYHLLRVQVCLSLTRRTTPAGSLTQPEIRLCSSSPLAARPSSTITTLGLLDLPSLVWARDWR